MGKLYVFEIDFDIFSGFNKNYDDFKNSSGVTLLKAIYKDIKSLQFEKWFSSYSRVPLSEDSTYAEINIVIDLDLLNQSRQSLTYIISSVIIPSIKKKFLLFNAPYEVITDSDYPSANTFSSGANGGGYLFSIGLGYKQPLSGPIGSTSSNVVAGNTGSSFVLPTTTTTTTTTTSTTTTTTTVTITPQTVVPQETSRGDLINQNQNQSPNDSGKNNITSTGIVNIFQPTIKPQDITLVSTTTANAQTTQEIANGLGYLPIVWYNAYQIDLENIQYLSLYDDGIAPCMKLNFVDSLGLMKDKAFPLDDTKVTLFVNSRSDQLKPIFIQFKIRDFANNNGILTIDSIMDASNLYIKRFKSYPNMNSNQALQAICKEIGLGFNTNITETNDTMTWLNTGKKPYDFINEVVEHSYISDQSFVTGYIDHYYNFNYIDIQKELSRDISNELGVVSNGLSDILKIADTGDNNVSRLFLTNDQSVEGQNIYFRSYQITNNSTSTSLEYGYKDVIKYYDANNKSLVGFTVNSIVNNSDSSILLKGAPQDNQFFNSNVNYEYTGKLDVDNMHKNYHFTPTNNNRNIIDTQKIGMEIEIPTPNYGIYRFQKIKIVLSSNTPTGASPMLNQRLSGDWLIIDIKFMYYDQQLRQIVTLVKRELELSDDELASEPQSKVTGDTGYRGSYDNPTPTGIGTTTNTTTIPTINNGPAVVGARNYSTSKLLPTTTWENIAANFIASKEGFEPNAKFDINHYRAGYGSDKKLVNGVLVEVTKDSTFTQLEAITTLSYEIKNVYGPQVAKNLGEANWNKLNNNQKAALASLGYNVGTGFVKHTYGQVIQTGISQGNYPTAATGILNGPKTAGGKFLTGLAKRRQEEASLFLS